MFWWESFAAVRASRRNRSPDVGHVAEHLGEHLDRHRPFEPDVDALVDDAHAAAPDLALEYKVRRQGAGARVELGALVGHGLGAFGMINATNRRHGEQLEGCRSHPEPPMYRRVTLASGAADIIVA